MKTKTDNTGAAPVEPPAEKRKGPDPFELDAQTAHVNELVTAAWALANKMYWDRLDDKEQDPPLDGPLTRLLEHARRELEVLRQQIDL